MLDPRSLLSRTSAYRELQSLLKRKDPAAGRAPGHLRRRVRERSEPLAWVMLKLHRGKHVRTPEGYEQIAKRHFAKVQTSVLHDLIAVPYTRVIMESREPERGKA